MLTREQTTTNVHTNVLIAERASIERKYSIYTCVKCVLEYADYAMMLYEYNDLSLEFSMRLHLSIDSELCACLERSSR